MDSIERLTGLSPDHGARTLELAWLPAPICLGVLGMIARRGYGSRKMRRIRP